MAFLTHKNLFQVYLKKVFYMYINRGISIWNNIYNYANLILADGTVKSDRTGTGTKSIFGYQMRFDLRKGFPLVTTKNTAMRLITSELLWFIKGDTNVKTLIAERNHIWDEWAFEKWVKSEDYDGPDMTDFGRRAAQDEKFQQIVDQQMTIFREKILSDIKFAEEYGDLGPVYGRQWRSWPSKDGQSIDQLKNVIESIKHNPDSRRHIVTAWTHGSRSNGTSTMSYFFSILCS